MHKSLLTVSFVLASTLLFSPALAQGQEMPSDDGEATSDQGSNPNEQTMPEPISDQAPSEQSDPAQEETPNQNSSNPTQPTQPTQPSQPAGPATGPTPTATSGVRFDRNDLLASHNALRAQHGTPALAWSAALERSSQTWADRCVFEHSVTQNGENLSWWTGSATPGDRVRDWYTEIGFYDFARGVSTTGAAVGHFTQIVWRDTREVGCAIAACNQGTTLVCQYSPAGNVQGQYVQQVPPVR